MKNESFEQRTNFESEDFSVHAIMERFARVQRGGRWTRRAIERAQQVGNEMLDVAYAKNIPLDVLVETGGHTIYCHVNDSLEPIHSDENDGILWGSMSQFVVRGVSNEKTHRQELTLCVVIDSYEKIDRGEYWIPLAATDSRIPKIKFTGMSNILDENHAGESSENGDSERSYRDLVAEVIFADGGTTSEKVMSAIRELYHSEQQLDVDQLTADVNMMLLKAAQEDEEVQVDFCGEIERRNKRGGWDVQYESEQPYTLFAIEFFQVDPAFGSVGAYAYMEGRDMGRPVVRSDMDSNNFWMTSPTREEAFGGGLEADDESGEEGSSDI